MPNWDDIVSLLEYAYNAGTGGHYAYLACLLLVIAVSLVRKYLGGKWAFLHSDAGAAILSLLWAFGTTMAAALMGGGPVTTTMLWSAAGVAFMAMGGYTVLKKIFVEPYLKPWSLKAPTWLAIPLKMIVWFFEHESDATPTPSA